MGLGMNIMGGGEFKRQQQAKPSADASGSAASPEPRPAHSPKEVCDLDLGCASVRLQHISGSTCAAGCICNAVLQHMLIVA